MSSFSLNGQEKTVGDGLEEHIRHQIKEVLQSFASVSKAILYGSRATGRFKTFSDIDLALSGHIQNRELATIRGLLEELSMPYKIDVIVLDTIKYEPLRHHVVEFGKLFYERLPP